MAPSANLSASMAPGVADDALDVGGELRLRPDHAIDAESRQAVLVRRRGSPRATRSRSSAAGPRRCAIAQVTMLTSSRPVQATSTSASLDARARQHLAARARAEHELHVERLEPLGDRTARDR